MNQAIKKNYLSFPPSIKSSYNDEFLKDILALFTEKQQGHMECWEYGTPEYSEDRAAGGIFWAKLIQNPGKYYLVNAEKELIREALNLSSGLKLQDIKTVIELGPGSEESLKNKTIPFLKSLPQVSSYVSVDSEKSQASWAAKYIKQNTQIHRTIARHQNFSEFSLNVPRVDSSALIMWGGTIGNISGFVGDNPYNSLLKSLVKLNNSISSGDHIFISFDTEDNEQSILEAYNHPLLSFCFHSPLYRLVRDSLVTGNFDPYKWKHESIWISETMQCAHTIFPLEDQEFELCGIKLFIPRFKRFVTNNSYKFKPQIMKDAATEAGFNPIIVQHGPMALLIAEKA
jgi:uncharacterized SAM-dependent methyltransferase